MRRIIERQVDRSQGVDPRRDESWRPELKPAPLASLNQPRPAAEQTLPKVESDPEVRAVADARRKRIIGWTAGVLGLLAAPLGYLGKGIVDSWTESQKAEDAAAKAQRVQIAKIARLAGVDPTKEPSVDTILEALAEKSAKCAAAATDAAEAKAEVKELQKNFLGYLVASGAVVRRTEGMPEPAKVEIRPAPRHAKPSVFSSRPEVRFPPPEKP